MPHPTVHNAPIGREVEIRAIHDALFGEAAGPRAIVLEGEPGIGKSALWRYAVELPEREQEARVLAVRPAHSERRLSWAALADLLEPVDESMLAALPPPQRRAVDIALLRAEPEVGPLDRRAVYTGFAAIMRGLAEDRPLVIAIDDLHWLDAASTSALDFAVRRINTSSSTRRIVEERPDPFFSAADRTEIFQQFRAGEIRILARAGRVIGEAHRRLAVRSGAVAARLRARGRHGPGLHRRRRDDGWPAVRPSGPCDGHPPRRDRGRRRRPGAPVAPAVTGAGPPHGQHRRGALHRPGRERPPRSGDPRRRRPDRRLTPPEGGRGPERRWPDGVRRRRRPRMWPLGHAGAPAARPEGRGRARHQRRRLARHPHDDRGPRGRRRRDQLPAALERPPGFVAR